MTQNFFCYVVLIVMILGKLIHGLQTKSLHDDILKPYYKNHGSKNTNRKIRSIQSDQFGNSTCEIWKAHISSNSLPIANTSYFISDIRASSWMSNHVYGHYTLINNPMKTFSVVEPQPQGCQHNTTATVELTAKSRNCIVAQNGGYFNTDTGACIGNIVSDGSLIQDGRGVQNAHFGITSNGSLVTGYFSESDLYNLNFTQLVGGVIWLVRDGKSYVEESVRLEVSDAEETGTLRYFTDVVSARTAIGHDREGRIVFVQLDGQTGARGANLNGFATFLIEQLGVVNAINLDGGGSATLVLNGTLANYPSDHCEGAPMWRCAREVSTVICAHEPDCQPPCVNGKCVLGKCKCDVNWINETCNSLHCGSQNCSQHGVCKPGGCLCSSGWYGDECDLPCPRGSFGKNCSQLCQCEGNSQCDVVTGQCYCPAGVMGKACDQKCPVGRYGRNCIHQCHCSEACFCDSSTGACLSNSTYTADQSFLNISHCLAKKNDTRNNADEEDYDLSMLRLLCFVIAALMLSVFCNVALMWMYVSRSTSSHRQYTASYRNLRSRDSEDSDQSESSSESLDERTEMRPSKMNMFLQKCFLFRSYRYKKIPDTNEEAFEMDSLSN